ncbi:hypothetical protein [Riemerella columbipharyngis]|uniref:hypothetical protein n=1 Tax=Riemerella columbipharyngis TaxID=1071918 RepID=UPI000B831949|nr:hypothetical protein [Riemerella columbipharyngis]
MYRCIIKSTDKEQAKDLFSFPELSDRLEKILTNSDANDVPFLRKECETAAEIWDIYNEATHFATHQLQAPITQRQKIQEYAYRLLMKKKYDLEAPFRISL